MLPRKKCDDTAAVRPLAFKDFSQTQWLLVNGGIGLLLALRDEPDAPKDLSQYMGICIEICPEFQPLIDTIEELERIARADRGDSAETPLMEETSPPEEQVEKEGEGEQEEIITFFYGFFGRNHHMLFENTFPALAPHLGPPDDGSLPVVIISNHVQAACLMKF